MSATLQNRPGKENHADYMSIHLIETRTTSRKTVSEEYVSFIAESPTPKAITWHDVRET